MLSIRPTNRRFFMDNERDSADPAFEAAKSAERAPQGQQPGQEVQVDDSHIVALYSNFCRVTGSPEELIVDFGLNPQPMGTPTKPVVVSQRIVLNYYTA